MAVKKEKIESTNPDFLLFEEYSIAAFFLFIALVTGQTEISYIAGPLVVDALLGGPFYQSLTRPLRRAI